MAIDEVSRVVRPIVAKKGMMRLISIGLAVSDNKVPRQSEG